MLARLDEAVSGFDQPSMDGINTYFVSWAARQAGLKVALSGLGSDELFGGYSTFRSTPQIARASAVRSFASRARFVRWSRKIWLGSKASARRPMPLARRASASSRSGRAAASIFLHASALHPAIAGPPPGP